MLTLRYAITDRLQHAEKGRHAALVAQAARLANAGVEYIQLREKELPAQDLIGLAREILSRIRTSCSRTKLLINARADIALAAGAAGVHLTSSEGQLLPAEVRRLFEAAGAGDITISVSSHTFGEVERAKKNGADLILFGPVFGKSIAGEIVVPGTSLEALAEACAIAGETPILALGGVTADNAGSCIHAGAKGIAGIRLFANRVEPSLYRHALTEKSPLNESSSPAFDSLS